MKVRISITLEESLHKLIKNKPNLSRYIEELVKEDIQLKEKKSIVMAVTSELLENEIFIQEVVNRVNDNTSSNTSSSNVVLSRGLPCCTSKSKVCSHWQWDNTEGIWRNMRTNETR